MESFMIAILIAMAGWLINRMQEAKKKKFAGTALVTENREMEPDGWEEELAEEPDDMASAFEPPSPSMLSADIHTESRPSSHIPQTSMNKKGKLSRQQLRQGMIMKEILGPPRAKKPYRANVFR
ncbi:hypothetical protein [Lihuaxuella thermophila]|uniref:Uncharacterized protein n=1 Tax=Lihuaxuella thermophila TaxID=1173111 RepID=A0A1H8DBB2_9BACL|nr:hypothetical protein [Lihuaxuella thermophila]SEN04456.1 hypothetical protein SAMN05444955_10588 [Lihuaxuella thermophila]